MEEIKEKMKSKLTDAKDAALLKKELKKTKDQLQKYNLKYAHEIKKETTNRAGKITPKIDYIDSVDYIWVTFKDSKANVYAKELFKKKGSVVLLAQKVMSSSTIKEELLLEGQELDVIDETVQPDQYLWHNLQYSFAEIRMISRIFKAFTIATAVVSLIISLTFSGL